MSIVHKDEDFDLIISQLLNNVDIIDFSENLPNTVKAKMYYFLNSEF